MMRIEIVKSEERFSQLKDEWNRLVADSWQNKHFHRHQWYDAWWSGFSPTIRSSRLNIYLFYDGDELVAIAPLMRDNDPIFGVPSRKICFMANPHSPRMDLIISRNVSRPDVCKAFVDQLLQEKGWNLIYLRTMLREDDETSTLNDLITELQARRLNHSLEALTTSPYFNFAENFDAYQATLDGHFRRNLRRRLRNIKKMGELKFEIFPVNGNEYRELLDEGLDLEFNGWKGRNGTAIKCAEHIYSFYVQLCENFRTEGELFFHTLRLDDRLLAFDYCFADHDTFHINKIMYEEEFRKYSPGNLLKLLQIEHCHTEHYKEYDFLGVNAPWKMDWADQMRHQADLLIYNSRSPIGLSLAFRNKWLLPRLRNVSILRKLKDNFLERRKK